MQMLVEGVEKHPEQSLTQQVREVFHFAHTHNKQKNAAFV